MKELSRATGRGQSVWMRPDRSARGPSPEHSRAEIAAAGVALADAGGLAAVTMRSVAAAIGTAPASLYRYVTSRDELVELMADQVYGEYTYREPVTDRPAAVLLTLARQGLAIYLRHPWLLDVPSAGGLPGPNAIAFIEYALAALAGAGLTGPARLETIGLFSGAIRLIAQAEFDQRRPGRAPGEWQDSLAEYLLRIAAADQYPNLAAALAEAAQGAGDGVGGTADPSEALFDRAMTRILSGLLQPGGYDPLT